jgi:hypothetical protein
VNGYEAEKQAIDALRGLRVEFADRKTFAPKGAVTYRDSKAARALLDAMDRQDVPEVARTFPEWNDPSVTRPYRWKGGDEHPPPVQLPIYGESDVGALVRRLHHDARFGEWLTSSSATARRYDDLIEQLDSEEDPSSFTLAESFDLLARLHIEKGSFTEQYPCECFTERGDFTYWRKRGAEENDEIEYPDIHARFDCPEFEDDLLVLRRAAKEWLPIALRAAGHAVDPAVVLHQRHDPKELWPIAKWPNEPGVYFVRAGDRVKIGKAKDVHKRLTDLQTSAPHKLELLAVAAGGYDEEGAYHRLFARSRLVGEWFRLDAEIVAEIIRLRRLPLRSPS